MNRGKRDAVLCVLKPFQRKPQGIITADLEGELRQNKRNTYFSILRL